MVTEARRRLADRLSLSIDSYEAAEGPLPGLTRANRESLVQQLVDSVRRNLYVEYLCSADLGRPATDPSDVDRFDPLKAAIVYHREGDDDAAFWMLFLFTHFGKHRRAGWRYAREVYGALGSASRWTWQRVVGHLDEFRDWLDDHQTELSDPTRPRGFGNHRKYESLAGWTPTGTGSVVASYVSWIGDPPQHRVYFDHTAAPAGNDPEIAFDLLYRSMAAVHRFGRTARFDYLSMIGKIGLADIQPGKAYLQGATGPRQGAQLLFRPIDGLNLTATALEVSTSTLRDHLGVTFDVMEDALCNWQKSPMSFKPFRG